MVRAGRGQSAVRPRTSYVEASDSDDDDEISVVATKIVAKPPPKKRAIVAKKPARLVSNASLANFFGSLYLIQMLDPNWFGRIMHTPVAVCDTLFSLFRFLIRITHT